ncbi:DNA repair protein RadB [Candidatus Bathyarchaeota archaeon]|nr:MAG: DNA repair protein RadB [Candidatus Bathyarchaeota archaeon]
MVQPLEGRDLRIPTGCKSLDDLLGGGIPSGRVTLIYGEAETGKTSLTIQCAVNLAKIGYRTIFVDSDGTFSPERLCQIAGGEADEVSARIIVVRPNDFWEQSNVIDNLDRYVTAKIGLIIFDTITSLYRAELGTSRETFQLNRELNRQVATLSEVTKEYGIATILTSQVRSVIDRDENRVEPVATRVLKFWSDIVISLRKTHSGHVKARLEKTPSGDKIVECYLAMGPSGIYNMKSE